MAGFELTDKCVVGEAEFVSKLTLCLACGVSQGSQVLTYLSPESFRLLAGGLLLVMYHLLSFSPQLVDA